MHESKGAKLAVLTPKIMSAFHNLGKSHPSGEGLSMRQFQALILVFAAEELTLSQICTRLNVAPSTGTELVNRMIEAGFFIKHGGEDKRKVLIRVTEKGEEVMRKRQAAMTEMFDRFLTSFSQEDQDTFIAAFEQIWEVLQKINLPKE